jgi:hypothetical protein
MLRQFFTRTVAQNIRNGGQTACAAIHQLNHSFDMPDPGQSFREDPYAWLYP